MPKPASTIYSYYMPAVRYIVTDTLANLNYDGEGGIHGILKQNYDPGLDELHLPLMTAYENFARNEGVIGLETFEHSYFTNGSSEGIFHLLARHASIDPIYQFEGEYQGYVAYAEALGFEIETIRYDEIEKAVPGTIIISNPASQDGNLHTPAFIKRLAERHKVIVDLAYMGMTDKPLNLDLTDSNIAAVVGSLSKPFGLYYYRIGFCYSRTPLDSLFGNKWFKNALSIKIGEAVLRDIDLQSIKDHYRKLQVMAVQDANNHFGLEFWEGQFKIQPSDVWLLGNLRRATDYDPLDMNEFKRLSGIWRFCLTPYYMAVEK